MPPIRIAMLGTGLIGNFYTETLHDRRGVDRVKVVYSRAAERAQRFADKWSIPKATNNLEAAVGDDEVDVVVIGLPNALHEAAVTAAVAAGKGVLCTKPLGRTAAEALRMLRAVEDAGVFSAYLEDLVYTPKTLKALASVREGAIGEVLWVRSRETHPGPHSDWFWDPIQAGGGAIIDMGCHCIEIARNFIGKDVRPVEVVCWADTLVHPIETEDHAIGLVRYENGAIGQFEVSWAFRGGMDLRDEISGTEGTIWLNHWLRTGMEMFSAAGHRGYVAEKAETAAGWLFPVGDEPGALGYVEMFRDVLEACESGGVARETFYDGYVVNAIMDTAYAAVRSRRWEPVKLSEWRGRTDAEKITAHQDFDDEHYLVKRERMPDGTTKLILRHKQSGEVVQRLES